MNFYERYNNNMSNKYTEQIDIDLDNLEFIVSDLKQTIQEQKFKTKLLQKMLKQVEKQVIEKQRKLTL